MIVGARPIRSDERELYRTPGSVDPATLDRRPVEGALEGIAIYRGDDERLEVWLCVRGWAEVYLPRSDEVGRIGWRSPAKCDEDNDGQGERRKEQEPLH